MAQETPQNNNSKDDTPLSIWIILLIPVYIIGIMSVIIFPIANNWVWLEGWLFIVTLAINMGLSFYLINKKNPRVLRNRAKVKKVGITEKTKKSAGSDKFIMPFLGLGFVGAMILPAIGHRYEWISIHFIVEIIGLVVLNIGVALMDIAMVQNAFASKLLDISKDQKLIDTGLYGIVRHPLYSGAVLMILGLPIALGSWISLIPAAVGILCLIVRIKFEEDMLIKGMEGYEDYRARVKYKLIPKLY